MLCTHEGKVIGTGPCTGGTPPPFHSLPKTGGDERNFPTWTWRYAQGRPQTGCHSSNQAATVDVAGLFKSQVAAINPKKLQPTRKVAPTPGCLRHLVTLDPSFAPFAPFAGKPHPRSWADRAGLLALTLHFTHTKRMSSKATVDALNIARE